MKRFFTYCISLLLAVWLPVAGSGLTVVHYCCHCSQAMGVKHIVEEHCDAPEHHQVHLHQACHCGRSCHLQYLAIGETTIGSDNDYTQDCQFVANLFYSIFSHSLTFCTEKVQKAEQRELCTTVPLEGGTVCCRDCSWLL